MREGFSVKQVARLRQKLKTPCGRGGGLESLEGGSVPDLESAGLGYFFMCYIVTRARHGEDAGQGGEKRRGNFWGSRRGSMRPVKLKLRKDSCRPQSGLGRGSRTSSEDMKWGIS